jgi:hypothetical protein
MDSDSRSCSVVRCWELSERARSAHPGVEINHSVQADPEGDMSLKTCCLLSPVKATPNMMVVWTFNIIKLFQMIRVSTIHI